ncbi:hypothetical protein V5799_015253 [Amblyomma americanum]|uniref:STAS domain-containing protein n=1 Tax=Amblyomma americanum TaxID=6943 RepID=A0AAQ4E0N7_AMBAM
MLEEKRARIKLADVDAIVESNLAEQHEIYSYPKLKFFLYGQSLDYRGRLNAEDVIRWLKMTGPVVQTLGMIVEAMAFSDSADEAIIEFFKVYSSKEAQQFLKAEDTADCHVFDITSDDAVYKELGANKDGVILLNKFDEGKNILDKDVTSDNEDFVQFNSLLLLTLYGFFERINDVAWSTALVAFVAIAIIMAVKLFLDPPVIKKLGVPLPIELTVIVSVVNIIIMVFMILFLGHYLEELPICVLAAIIVTSLKSIVMQVRNFKRYWDISKIDGQVWIVSFSTTVVFDIITGLACGVGFSLLTLIYKIQRPKTYLLGPVADTEFFVPVKKYQMISEVPKIKIFHFGGPIHFANAEYFKSQLSEKVGFTVR